MEENNLEEYYVDESLAVTPPNASGAALALGIIGLVMAIIGGGLFGVIGGFLGLVLGVLAICLGQSAKNKTENKKGKGGLVLGIISVCFGVIMSVSFLIAGFAVRAVANDQGLPLLAKHGTSLTFGAVGLIVSIGSEDDLDELKAELKQLGHFRVRY